MPNPPIRPPTPCTLFGIPALPFSMAAAIIIGAAYLGVLPNGMIGAFALLIAFGTLFAFAGDHTPILKDYLGGAPLVCVFGAAALVYFELLPSPVIANVNGFMKGGGFLNFYVASLITGSILGMDAKLLKVAGARYALPLVGGVIVAMSATSLVGELVSGSWRQSLLFVCFPIIGGGMGAGAVPMSEIVSSISSAVDAQSALSRFVPALAIANVLAIVIAGLLDKLGKLRPNLTGNGVLLKGFSIPKSDASPLGIEALGAGLFLTCVFFVFGEILAYLIPAVHSYALMIISVGTLKILNALPKSFERACNGWYNFVVKNFTAALLFGIGIAYTDLNEVFTTLSPAFILQVVTAVVSIVIASGYIGTKVGFHFVESALTSGLGMADMGGTGDVAVLSAARRMELMPFMQISSRLGGGLILLLVSLLAPALLG